MSGHADITLRKKKWKPEPIPVIYKGAQGICRVCNILLTTRRELLINTHFIMKWYCKSLQISYLENV